MEEEGGMETEITKRVGVGWRNLKKCSGVRQKDASETEGEGIQHSDQASNAETWATTKDQGNIGPYAYANNVETVALMVDNVHIKSEHKWIIIQSYNTSTVLSSLVDIIVVWSCCFVICECA